MYGLKTSIILFGGIFLAFSGRADDDLTLGRSVMPTPSHLEAKHRKTENQAVIGIVEKISGPCFVIRGGHGGRIGISIGLRVFESDHLVTDETSRLHVRYKDGTYVEMGSVGEFEVERLRFKAPNPYPANKAADNFDESVFRFHHGVMRVTAPDVHSHERFLIKTTNAVLKVSGPADFYLIQVKNDDDTSAVNDKDLTIRVSRGSVEMMNTVTNEVMTVSEGSGALVRVTGSVTKGGPFTSEQLTFLKSRTRI